MMVVLHQVLREAYYLGFTVYILFFAFMGTIVRYLDYLSFNRKRKLHGDREVKLFLISKMEKLASFCFV